MVVNNMTITVTAGGEKISPKWVKAELFRRITEITKTISRCIGGQGVFIDGVNNAKLKEYHPDIYYQCDKDAYLQFPKRNEYPNIVFFVGRTILVVLNNFIIGCSNPGYGGQDTVTVHAEPETLDRIKRELMALEYKNDLNIKEN